MVHLVYCDDKKKIMKIFLIIIVAIVILLACLYAYYGGLKKVEIKIQNQGGETIIYESVIGDYNQTPKYTDKVYYDLLNNEGIETTKGIGIFYDNPKNVDKNKLRSDVGCVLDDADNTVIAKISGKYQIKTLPEGNYIYAEFPMKGSVSFIIGIMKVYPTLNAYCEKHGYKDSPITEIYDVPNKKIIYRKLAVE